MSNRESDGNVYLSKALFGDVERGPRKKVNFGV